MNGQWIWLSSGEREDVYGEFRVEFFHGEAPAFLEISADNDYAVFLNRRFVYAGQYADFPWYKIYDRIPLAGFAKAGKNVLSIIAYHGDDASFNHKVGNPMLRFSLWEGERCLASSGADTPSRLAPGIRSGRKKSITRQLGYSFALDPAFLGGAFAPSQVVTGPGEVRLRPIERLAYEEPKAMLPLPGGVYDAGEETFGAPLIEARIPQGEKMTVSFGEWLDEKGHVAREIGPRDFSFELYGNGEACSYFQPMRKLGFRYLDFQGPGEVLSVKWVPFYYPFAPKKHSFSSPLRQRIYDVAVRTLRLNAMDHYFDCPWREQAFYALDSRSQMRYGAYAFAGHDYQRAALKLMSEDRCPKGLISITVPTDDPEVIPSFALYYVIAMNDYAQGTGDVSLLREYLPKLKSILAQVLAQKGEGGLLENFPEDSYWNFYEWNPGLEGAAGADKLDACLNLTSILALESFAESLRLLGEEASDYEKEASALKEAVNRAFFDEGRGLYRTTRRGGYSALVNSYALLTGTVPSDKAEGLAEHLTHPDADLLPCTLSMLASEYDALLAYDRAKYSSFVLHDIDEKFGGMVERGATTFWETLKGKDDFGGAGSLCHGWSALPACYYVMLDA